MSFMPQYHNRVILSDELARLELLRLQGVSEHGEKLCDLFATMARTADWYRCRSGYLPLDTSANPSTNVALSPRPKAAYISFTVSVFSRSFTTLSLSACSRPAHLVDR